MELLIIFLFTSPQPLREDELHGGAHTHLSPGYSVDVWKSNQQQYCSVLKKDRFAWKGDRSRSPPATEMNLWLTQHTRSQQASETLTVQTAAVIHFLFFCTFLLLMAIDCLHKWVYQKKSSFLLRIWFVPSHAAAFPLSTDNYTRWKCWTIVTFDTLSF